MIATGKAVAAPGKRFVNDVTRVSTPGFTLPAMPIYDPFAPLLSTKLYIPRRQPLSQRNTFVARPHLLARLTAGLTGKLTLIAAPAGFGKSTLLSEWLDEPASDHQLGTTHPPRPTFCWLTLEESDNDPIRFWLYFIAALQAMNPGLSADTPALLQSPEPPPIETILTIFLNDLSAWSGTLTPAIVLILEDYHVITAPAIHHGLSFLLEHLPPTLHLVITTRADPPLPLARLRTRGELSEIRADDLRFTSTETALFLNERMKLHLSPEQIQLLAVRTEGWIVGLQLAALSMQGYDDKAEFLHSFSGGHRYILNYLIEEVLNQQPKAIQEFLLHTSILTRLCGPLCDAVIGGGEPGAGADAPAPLSLQSQAVLEQIAQANLFLVPLDDRGQWYRYHQLFAEVLQYRLRQSQPALLPVLYRRASVWYAHHDYLADAIHHALLGADFTYAAALIEQVWPPLWNQGAMATLFTWMQALPVSSAPQQRLWGQPALYVSYAWGLALTGQIEAAEASLRQVEATLQPADPEMTAPSPHNILLGRATALRAMVAARRGAPAAAMGLAEQALALMPAQAPARGDAYYALGLAQQQQGLLVEAFRAYEAAATLSEAVHDSFLSVAARYHEARILMAQGELQKAATSYQQMLTLAASSKKQLPVVRLAHVGYGEVLYQWNDLPAAARHVDTGLALSPRHDVTYTDGPLHRFSILARIRQAIGDRAGALAAVGLAKETAAQTGIALDVERAAALEALIQLRLGAMADAVQWATHYARQPTTAERFPYLHEFESLVFVRILLAQQRAQEALTLLAEWLPLVEAAQRQGTVIELYLLQALALGVDGQAAKARQTLLHALTLAEPEGYIRLFVDEGEALRLLLVELGVWLAEQGSTETTDMLMAYHKRLLGAFAPQTALPDEVSNAMTEKTHHPQAKIQDLIEPLTDRERDVLRLIAAGLSNAAIAEALVVSVGTVKTHLKHIYGKLAVQSRTQAVARARTLDLV